MGTVRILLLSPDDHNRSTSAADDRHRPDYARSAAAAAAAAVDAVPGELSHGDRLARMSVIVYTQTGTAQSNDQQMFSAIQPTLSINVIITNHH